MIQRVAQNMSESGFDYAVVTDDDRIENEIKKFQGQVVRVDDDVPSGTERIALAYERYFKSKKYDFVINVQGDEPLLKKDAILALVDFHQRHSFDITTLVKKRTDLEDYNRSDVVKVAMAQNHNCLYFSRAAIPFYRDGKDISWLQHIGVYSYRAQSLLEFIRYPVSKLEDTEKLEQLRALENGLKIGGLECSQNLIGVDSPHDIKKVEKFINE